ncbi:MAG: hypothetical protein HYS44_03015 [Candidatus Niyogibacteria bacterium]|nr:hypothetical protein [Candidatus Niyogibacteria bacterium]
MFEETGIVGRLFTWTEEHTTKNNKTGGMKTEFRLVTRFEGAILNRNSRINRLLVAIQYLKHHLEREPTREEIAEEIRRRTPLESQEHWRRTLEYLQGQLGRDPTADEIVAELKQRNDDESNPYWRTVFICVAMNPGDENTQALSPEGPPQTQGFQWLPIAAPPHIETNEERWDREQKDGPAPKHAYYTHVHTVLDARILSALERIKLQPDINAEPGEDIATLRALWKTAGASDTKILN